MKSINKTVIGIRLLAVLVLTLNGLGCKKLVEVNAPVTSTDAAVVYSSDATAISVLTGLYTNLSSSSISIPGYVPSLSLFAGLSADELTLSFNGYSAALTAYYTNALASNVAGYEYWEILYGYIFTCNSAIEGLQASTGLTPAVKQQLLGEAEFMRAFFYFYLTNLYGDVPLALGTDYKVNAVASRSPQADVYQQIIEDLKNAETALSSNYLDATLLKTTTERTRPTRWAAMALLARAYLSTGDWIDAEAQSDSVIENSTLFNLTTLRNVFLKNSTEAIWQLQPVTNGTITNTSAAVLFIIPATGPASSYPVSVSNSLLGSFEPGDSRRTTWIDSVIVNGVTYYYPYKYRVNGSGAAVSEYSMIFRLGEQYLIRAEAEAQQGSSSAVDDLNAIRSRAGLANYSGATDKTSLLTAILHERQVELFTELGQRWLDLKRTGTVNTVMNIVTPEKGGTWSSNAQLYPIALFDIQYDPNLVQNSGY